MISSLAAAGALIFGAAPIVSRPQLSWSDDRPQLAVALIAGCIGLLALVLLIGSITQLLAPVKVSLADIPTEMEAEIDASPKTRLPSGARTYGQFLENYRFYKLAVARLEDKLTEYKSLDPAAADHIAKKSGSSPRTWCTTSSCDSSM